MTFKTKLTTWLPEIDIAFPGLLIILAALFPFWSSTPAYTGQIILLGAIYAIALLGLDLIVGYAGALSIGHAALFGVGAYTTGVLTLQAGFPGWLALPISAILAGCAGWLMSLPLLKANDKYVALGTLVFGLSASIIFNEWNSITGGSIGLTLPPQRWAGLQLSTYHYTYLALILLVLSIKIINTLTQSSLGRAFEAMRDAPIAAECMGIHVNRHKQGSFVMGGLFAGLAGGLFALSQGYIASSSFSFEMSVNFLLALMLGGKKSRLGILLGAAVVIFLPLMLSSIMEWHPIIYGGLILLATYVLPGGIVSLLPHKYTSKKTYIAPVSHDQKAIHLTSHTTIDTSILALDNVSMRFDAFYALKNVTLHIKPGTIAGIIGPNGAGKSTLINILTGIYTQTDGDISFCDQSTHSWATSKLAQAGIARTFQNLQIFCGLSVLENILVGLHHCHENNPLKIATGLHTKKDFTAYERAWSLLHLVNLHEYAHTLASALSYGQKRFLEIARALACNPKLLLLDEPAAGMRGADLEQLKVLIQSIRRHGIAVLLIEHHIDIITTLSDHIFAFNFGELIAHGSPEHVITHHAVKEAYLGS
ncbi:MAG: branched-chain amino acid ABC transporter ATP-binding protein/permease [Pseudomonadota bacterium]